MSVCVGQLIIISAAAIPTFNCSLLYLEGSRWPGVSYGWTNLPLLTNLPIRRGKNRTVSEYSLIQSVPFTFII